MPRNPHKTEVFSVSVPKPLAVQVERYRKSEHRTRSQVVSDALRVYLARAAIIAQIDELLLEGINSGESIPITAEWWQQRRAAVAAKRRAAPAKRRRS